MEYHIYWLLKSYWFGLFGDRRYAFFFEPESWWKDDIYWLLKSSCFELFGDWKQGIFFSQKVDGKMIFTWCFWTFQYISGLGKYDFSCGETCCSLQIISLKLINELFWIFYPSSLLKMTPHKSTSLCFYTKIFIFLIKFVFQNLQPLLKKRGFKLWLTSTW